MERKAWGQDSAEMLLLILFVLSGSEVGSANDGGRDEVGMGGARDEVGGDEVGDTSDVLGILSA